MIRTINNVIRTLLFQAHLPPQYWVEALFMATHLLNPPQQLTMRYHSQNSLTNTQLTNTYAFLVAFVIHIFIPPINSNLDPQHVFFWDILLITEAIVASILPQTKSLSPDM